MPFPRQRLRRLRKSAAIRNMVRETELSLNDIILPLFVTFGKKVKNPIESMPGHYQFSIDNLKSEVQQVKDLGIPSVILFGITEKKDDTGSEAYNPDGVIQRAVKVIKDTAPDLVVITDVCLCEYTTHGQCGIVSNGEVENDSTIELLAREAVSHTEAGADIVAPSDMMDGRVSIIRRSLDQNNFQDTPIMSYAAKYSSAFYGPFRDAAESAPIFGDRRGYQMDPANSDEAMREVALDIEEGADIIMVKPALPYLDIIKRVKDEFAYPLAAYNVSGEFAMVKAAGKMGWIDEEKVMMESLISIKRAGADMIITYFAKEAARVIANRN